MLRVGTICYATRQGIGWIPKRYYDAGVITDVVILHHHARHNHLDWYPEGTPVVAIRPFDKHECIHKLLEAVDVMLFIETPFDWDMLRLCRQYNVKSVIQCMYECTPQNPPYQPDLWMCPSLLDCEYFDGPFVPVPVPSEIKWKLRTTANRFLHNGGNLGLRGHKGTLEILQAMEYVKSAIELKVTSQDAAGLEKIKQKVPSCLTDTRIQFDTTDVPWETLYDNYDVFIMAEKYNGLSLPLQEAWASGLFVITSDRYPMNTWLPRRGLIPVSRYQKARVGGPFMEYDEAVIDPKNIALTIDRLYETSIEKESKQGRAWAKLNSWDVLKPVIMEHLANA